MSVTECLFYLSAEHGSFIAWKANARGGQLR